jgi:hypothetical protein
MKFFAIIFSSLAAVAVARATGNPNFEDAEVTVEAPKKLTKNSPQSYYSYSSSSRLGDAISAAGEIAGEM